MHKSTNTPVSLDISLINMLHGRIDIYATRNLKLEACIMHILFRWHRRGRRPSKNLSLFFIQNYIPVNFLTCSGLCTRTIQYISNGIKFRQIEFDRTVPLIKSYLLKIILLCNFFHVLLKNLRLVIQDIIYFQLSEKKAAKLAVNNISCQQCILSKCT